ncbi:MAG TPA: LiaF-related protein [Candidatus Cloacimonadota bacterium]|nr:LiaF-related protein [Candidatus Cloacimonadota bacterium]
MKMDILSGSLFWGILVILIGLSIILKGFNINIPLVKSFIAIVIILFGIKILVGSHHKTRHTGISSSSTTGRYTEFSNIFSSGNYDFSDLNPVTDNVEVTVVFGSATVYLPADIEFDFDSNAVLGSVILPGTTHAGITSQESSLNTGAKRRIHVEANSIFGRLEFIMKKPEQSKARADSSATTDTLDTSF